MRIDLFYCRWAAVLLGLTLGATGQNQALGQADVESFIRQMDGLQLLLKADAGVTRGDQSAKGGTANGVKGWADYSGRGNHLANAYEDPATWPEWLAAAPGFGGKPALKFGGGGGSNFAKTQGLIGRVKSEFALN